MTSEQHALILAGPGYELSIAPTAEEQRTVLLAEAMGISTVTDPESNQIALAQIKRLAAMRNLVEKSRKIAKDPILAKGKEIDTVAANFVEPLDAQEKRITALVGTYAAKVEAERIRVAREMEAKRQAEEAERRKAERERIAAELEAERLRKEAEAAEAAANAALWDDDAATIAKREEEAAAAQTKAEESMKLAQEVASNIVDIVKVVAIVPPAAGAKFVPEFEVEDIHALYSYSPVLVNLEPRRADILDLLKHLTKDDILPSIPGLKVFLKPVIKTR